MRKLLTILFVFGSLLSFAQSPKISPFYPDIIPHERGQIQFTYHDFNFVSVKVQNYLERNMALSMIDSEYNISNDGTGTIVQVFEESMIIGSNRKPKKINFIYTVENIGHDFVVKSCRINGDSEKVLIFFTSFWKTTLQLSDLKAKSTAYNFYIQDKASIYYNNGSYYIDIKNTSIIDFKEFESEYLRKKENVLAIREEKRIEQEKIDLIKKQKQKEEEEKQEELRKIVKEKRLLQKNTQVSKTLLTVVKRKDKIEFHKDVSSMLMSDVESFLKDKDDGEYSMHVSTTYHYKKEVKNELQIYRFKPRKSLGKKLLNYY